MNSSLREGGGAGTQPGVHLLAPNFLDDFAPGVLEELVEAQNFLEELATNFLEALVLNPLEGLELHFHEELASCFLEKLAPYFLEELENLNGRVGRQPSFFVDQHKIARPLFARPFPNPKLFE